MLAERLSRIQDQLAREGLDGWLLYDAHGINPVAQRVVGLPADRVLTRRWACFVPRQGSPRWLVHAIEHDQFEGIASQVRTYVSWQEWREGLRALLGSARRVAMEYAPGGTLPAISRVDAGTVELVRSLGVEVLSSADLIQVAEAAWSPEQLAAHRRAARALMAIKDMAFALVGERLRNGHPPTEVEVQQFILDQMREHDLVTAHPPIVAVGSHTANPHFVPTPENTRPIRPHHLVLIDLWAREQGEHGVYADITWVAYTAPEVPDRVVYIFEVVKQARDAALAFIRDRLAQGAPIYGYEVDEVARTVIREAGYAHAFVHRTGHSLGREVHGNGVNMDNLETQDRRQLLPGLGFTVEPGIYLPEEGLGIRLEVDAYVDGNTLEITTLPLQEEIVVLME